MNLNRLQLLYDFKDRTILVMGGSGVLGLEIVYTLVESNVIIFGLDRERAVNSVAESIKQVKCKGLMLCVYVGSGLPNSPAKPTLISCCYKSNSITEGV